MTYDPDYDDFDDVEDLGDVEDLDEERYSPPRFNESSPEEKRKFGRKCKLMMQLLAVNNQLHEFDDAKAWVKLWPDSDDPTVEAAEWIEDGWDPEWVEVFLPRGLVDINLVFTENALNLNRMLAHRTPDEFATTWIVLDAEGIEFFQAGGECEGDLDWLMMSDAEFEVEKQMNPQRYR